MEEHKKKVLILIGTILVFISLLAILLGIIFKDDKEDKPSDQPGNSGNKVVVSKGIELLSDIDIFFGLQNVINNYYEMIKNKETDDLLNILDKDYLNINSINAGNLYTKLVSDLKSTSFVIKNVYYNPNSSITYYFINGYFTNVSILDEDDFLEYIPNVNYLVIVNNKGNYEISPLKEDINIESFAKTYNIENKNISSTKYFSVSSTSEKNKLSIYINEFLNLMFYDNELAYNMLDDNTKNKYNDRNDFENQIINIYNNLSTIIFGFSFKEVNGEKIYNITDDKQNKITIYEKNLMNYKIGY